MSEAPRAATPVLGIAGTATASATMLLLGVVSAFYGPLIPTLEAQFEVSAATAGTVVSAQFVGFLLGVVLVLRSTGVLAHRQLLTLSTMLMSAGMIGFAVAPNWPLLLVSTVLLGTGFGGLDLGINTMMAAGFGERSGALINLVNGLFGAGAVLGPVLVALFPRMGLYLGATLFLLCLLPVLRTAKGGGRGEGDNLPKLVMSRPLLFFALAYLGYLGVESGTTAWLPTQVRALGLPDTMVTLTASGFWLAAMVGRFAAVPIALRVSVRQLVLGCCALTVVGLLLASVPVAPHVMAPLGYVIVGLGAGPIFPTGLVWVGQQCPRSPRAASAVVALASVGGILIPPLLGVVVEGVGPQWVSLFVAGIAVAMLGAFLAAGAVREPLG